MYNLLDTSGDEAGFWECATRERRESSSEAMHLGVDVLFFGEGGEVSRG